ncbi:MAG: hypothetical protein WBQ50_15460 [Nocardioides sp.]
MSITQHVRTATRRATRQATRWPLHSQEVALRNAMLASTALAQGRIERLEVEEFLDGHLRARAERLGTVERAG